MRYLITIVAGTTWDKYGQSLNQSEFFSGLEQIRRKLTDTFGGYTETKTVGGWHDGEMIYEEPGRQWSALTGHIDSVVEVETTAKQIAEYAAEALQQASVLYYASPVIGGLTGE